MSAIKTPNFDASKNAIDGSDHGGPKLLCKMVAVCRSEGENAF